MTDATRNLIHELSRILDENRCLLLSGGTGVGKTYPTFEVVRGFNLLKSNAAIRGWLTVFITDMKARGDERQPVALLL